MCHPFNLVLASLLCLSLATAQITFTREWVAGKRSAGSTIRGDGDAQLLPCRSLRPAIEYLIQVEQLQSGSRIPGLEAMIETRKPYEIVTPVVFRKDTKVDPFLRSEDESQNQSVGRSP